MIRLLIAGEGKNEIGDAMSDPHEGARPSGGGAIEELLGKVRPSGWEIRATRSWKNVKKLKPNAPGEGDEKTIAGLALAAREEGCHALVFLRDSDDPKTGGGPAREREILRAIENEQGNRLEIAGGIPITMLESWLLALRGEKNAHADRAPAESLQARHRIPAKSTPAIVQLIRNARLLDAPPDATSLWRWLRLVARALGERIPTAWPNP